MSARPARIGRPGSTTAGSTAWHPRGLHFDTIQLAFEAAIAGLGVALGRRPLVDCDLASSALVELYPEAMVAETAYWLVSSEGADHRPDLLGFKRWLLGEAKGFEAGPPPN